MFHELLKNLFRTNAPLVLMYFPDYRNSTLDIRRVLGHELYLDYLKNYTTYFNIRKYIKVNFRLLTTLTYHM